MGLFWGNTDAKAVQAECHRLGGENEVLRRQLDATKVELTHASRKANVALDEAGKAWEEIQRVDAALVESEEIRAGQAEAIARQRENVVNASKECEEWREKARQYNEHSNLQTKVVRDLQADIAAMSERILKATLERDSATIETDRLTDTVAAQAKTIARQEEELGKWNRHTERNAGWAAGLQETIHEQTAKIAMLNEEVGRLKRCRVEDPEVVAARLSEQIVAFDAIKARAEKAEADAAGYCKDANRLASDFRTVCEQRNNLAGSIDTLKSSVKKAEASLHDMRTERDHWFNQAKQNARDCDAFAANFRTLEANLSATLSDRDAARTNADRWQESATSLEDQLGEWIAQHSSDVKALVAATDRIDRLTDDLQQAKAQTDAATMDAASLRKDLNAHVLAGQRMDAQAKVLADARDEAYDVIEWLQGRLPRTEPLPLSAEAIQRMFGRAISVCGKPANPTDAWTRKFEGLPNSNPAAGKFTSSAPMEPDKPAPSFAKEVRDLTKAIAEALKNTPVDGKMPEIKVESLGDYLRGSVTYSGTIPSAPTPACCCCSCCNTPGVVCSLPGCAGGAAFTCGVIKFPDNGGTGDGPEEDKPTEYDIPVAIAASSASLSEVVEESADLILEALAAHGSGLEFSASRRRDGGRYVHIRTGCKEDSDK